MTLEWCTSMESVAALGPVRGIVRSCPVSSAGREIPLGPGGGAESGGGGPMPAVDLCAALRRWDAGRRGGGAAGGGGAAPVAFALREEEIGAGRPCCA